MFGVFKDLLVLLLLFIIILRSKERDRKKRGGEKKTGIQPKEKSLKQINPMPFKLTW